MARERNGSRTSGERECSAGGRLARDVVHVVDADELHAGAALLGAGGGLVRVDRGPALPVAVAADGVGEERLDLLGGRLVGVQQAGLGVLADARDGVGGVLLVRAD